jgi:hypothetical protein
VAVLLHASVEATRRELVKTPVGQRGVSYHFRLPDGRSGHALSARTVPDAAAREAFASDLIRWRIRGGESIAIWGGVFHGDAPPDCADGDAACEHDRAVRARLLSRFVDAVGEPGGQAPATRVYVAPSDAEIERSAVVTGEAVAPLGRPPVVVDLRL